MRIVRRLTVVAALVGLAGAGQAQGIPFPAPPVAVTVYADGAMVERSGEADLPAGLHELLVPLTEGATAPNITVEGGRLLGVRFAERFLADEGTLRDAAQEAAAAEVERLEDALDAARDARAETLAAVAGEEARIEVLLSTEGGGDPVARAAAVAGAVAEARAALVALASDLRAAEARVTETEEALADARTRLARLGPPDPDAGGVVVLVDMAEAGPVGLTIHQFTSGARWYPSYDLRLESESGALTVERQAVLDQSSGVPWRAVDLRLSTDRARGRLAPFSPGPDIAYLSDPDEGVIPMARGTQLRESIVDAPMIVEEVEDVAAAVVQDGLALSYDYPVPVDVPSGGNAVLLALGTVEIETEPGIRALPEFEATGYLVARARNPGETLIPGEARYWRDGALVGTGALPLWAGGAEEELAFGPVETIRLDHVLLSQGTGDRGFITRGTERIVEVRFSIENTGDEAREVQARYTLPISEQEDLEIETISAPAPDAIGVDDVRGLAEWAMTLAPGERREVEIEMRLNWPEGQSLLWAP